jgi:Zn-dependent protease with chaperone function
MDFFKQQDIARTKTTRLIGLFILAVVAIALAVYVVALAVVYFHQARQPGFNPYSFEMIQPELGFWVLSVTLLVIFIGSITKIIQLAKGGSAVAENQGGRLINASATDALERRLINVIEEMSIASGVPVPQIYILEDEKAINAFAAGYSPNDAAVAVTRGCLTELSRDELQGVIAHEFSHILNGDMRLNIRLIGFLSGIMVLAQIGYLILRSRSSSRKSGAQIVLVGIGLLAIGFMGQLFGRMIQAAVSRQREYFSDASAVQFTRNPGGIAGALIKIGTILEGSRIQSPHAGEICHMFFGSAIRSAFATHPPLRERIRRIEPDYKRRFIPQEVSEEKPEPVAPELTKPAVAAVSTPAAALAVDADSVIRQPGNITAQNIAHSRHLLTAIPEKIKNELSDILGAMAVTCMLLLDEDPQVRDIQMKRLHKRAPGRLVQHIVSLEPYFKSLDLQLRLPILDLALPVLRQMSAGQYAKFKAFIQILVEADARLSFFEFALQQIITHRLGASYRRHKREDSRWKMLPAGKVSFGALRVALQRFSSATPGVKKTFLDACAHCVLHDEHVTLEEAELLRVVAYALDIPLPPFLETFNT